MRSMIYTSEGHFLYPYLNKKFRVVIVPPKRNFSIKHFYTIYDYHLAIGFLVFYSFWYVAEKYLIRDPVFPGFASLGVSMLSEVAGQPLRPRHKFMSMNFTRALYFFFLFVYYVTYMGVILRLMTNSAEPPTIFRLASVKNLHIDIVVTTAYTSKYPNLQQMITDRMQSPVVMTNEKMLLRMSNEMSMFATVFDEGSLPRMLSSYLPKRKYKIVKESFGRFEYAIHQSATKVI